MKGLLAVLESLKYFGLRKLYWLGKRLLQYLSDILIDLQFTNPRLQQSFLKHRFSRNVVQIYNGDDGHNIDFNTFFLGFGLIHYALVRNTKPKNILCVGSRRGYIPAILALSCKDNDIGHVDFVDAGYDEDTPEKNWGGVGFWKKNDPNTHFSKLSIEKYITTHVMKTSEFAKLFSRKKYQYIYIDGDHSYKGAQLDYMLFWPKLEKHGFMVFHDIVPKGYLDNGKFGVWKLWKEISQKNAISFPFPKDSGLGILQKK